MKRVTLADIAHEAGVHKTTVARALRNSPRIGAAVRHHIRHLAETMGYRPDPHLSRLMAQIKTTDPAHQTDTIALWNPLPHSLRDDWVMYELRRMCLGAAEEAARHGYQLEEFYFGDAALTPRRLEKILQARGIRAVLIFPAYDVWSLDLEFERLAAVTLSHSLKSPAIHKVLHDAHYAMRTLLHHVEGLGFKRIGIVLPPKMPSHEILYEIHTGVVLAHRHWEKMPSDIPILYFDPAEGTPPTVLAKWFDQYQPDVVVSSNERVLEVMRRELGLDVPGQVSYASTALGDPRDEISGIRPPAKAIGGVAIRKLISMLHSNETGLPRFPETIEVPGTLETGKTLRAPDRETATADFRPARAEAGVIAK
jgi:LacI family transcriptional regulator